MKFLRLLNGLFAEATTVQTSAGAADADKIPSLDAGGKLSSTMMPAGLGADTRDVVASEAIAAGDLVNLWNDSGTLKVRKADNAVAGKEAVGFAQSAISSAATGTVTFDGTISGKTGLTIGARYWLGTSGSIVATAPSTSGNVVQCVGIAASAPELVFEQGCPVTLA
jgi:hypothetical protein